MKKLLNSLVILTVIFLAISTSFAEDLFPRESGSKPNYVKYAGTDADKVVVGYPCSLYAVSLYNENTLARIDIVDSSTATAGTVSTIAVELAEAVAGKSNRWTFDPPIQLKNGIYIDVTTDYSDNVIVEYR